MAAARYERNHIVNGRDDDIEMIIINDEDDDEKLLDLGISSPRLRKLRWFLMATLQILPSSLQRHIPARYQRRAQLFCLLLNFVAVCLQYFYQLGVFHNKTLVEEELKLTLTSFKNIVWNMRYPLYSLLGLVFFINAHHLNDLLSSFKLTNRSLKQAKRFLAISISLVFLFSVLVPAGMEFMEMCYDPNGDKKKGFRLSMAILNTVLMIAARTLALPIVVIFLVVFTLLFHQMKQYERHIKKWPANERSSARRFILNTKKIIKKAESAFQLFLIVHIAILLLVFVPGILGFVEQERSEGSYTHTWQTTPLNDLANNNVVKEMLGLSTNRTQRNDSTNAAIVIIKIPIANKPIPPEHDTTSSLSRKRAPVNLVTNHREKLPDKNMQVRIALEAIAFLLETLSLYIPIVLIGTINKVLSSLPEVFGCLDFQEQQANGCIFQSWKDVKDMRKDFKYSEGVHILNMELTVIKSMLLAVAMPLFTLLIHIMEKQVDLSS